MKTLTLVRTGSVPQTVMVELAGFLAERLNTRCSQALRFVDPKPAWVAARRQYETRPLFELLDEFVPGGDTLVLGVADVDIFSSVFTFVFGEARLGGPTGLFSLHRLRPELYGMAASEEVLLSRARREALHEAGHLMGLIHCLDPDCAMHFSAVAEEIDLKSDNFCTTCRELLNRQSTAVSEQLPAE